MKSYCLLILFSVLIACPAIFAQNERTSSQNKKAFVVGVANYQPVGKLYDTINDARLISETLASIGFKIHSGEPLEDPNAQKLRDEFAIFSAGLVPGDTVVIYFSGHGAQSGGENLLLPVDYAGGENEALLLGTILTSLERARVKVSIVLLDCCRSSGSSGSGIAVSGGLAQPDSEVTSRGDVLIGFAAKHGEFALEGAGSNSPFAEALAKRLALPGVALRTTFDQVTRDVLEKTNQKQQPFFYGSLRQEVYLAGLPSGTGLDSTAGSSMIGGPKTLDKLVSLLLDSNTREEVQNLVGKPQKSYVIKSSSSELGFDMLYERIGTDKYMIQFFFEKADGINELKLAGMVVKVSEDTALPVYRGHTDNTLFSLMHTTMGQILENHRPESTQSCGGGRYPTVVGNFYFARPGGYMNYLLPAPMTDIDTEEADLEFPFMSFGLVKNDALAEFLGEYVACPPEWVEVDSASSDISTMVGMAGVKPPRESESSTSTGTQTERKAGAFVTALGGYTNDWVVITSANSPYSSQRWTTASAFPKSWIKEGWDSGYRISHLAGDWGEWFVVMSKRKDGVGFGQSYSGPGKIDQTWIAQKWEEGYRITVAAGWQEQWIVVMNSGTGWGRQRFTNVGAFKDEWVAARYKEGYAVTSVAGDIVEASAGQPERGSYFMVATQGTGWEQTWRFVDQTKLTASLVEFKEAGWSVTGWAPWKKDRGVIFFSKGLPGNEGKGFGYSSRAGTSNAKEWIEKMVSGSY